MNGLRKIWERKWVLRAIIPSIIFNFRHLPFSQAFKVPILLYKAKLINCRGNFQFNCPVKFGLVILGKNIVQIYPNSGISLQNQGTIIFNGKLTIGNDSFVSVGKSGILEFGSNIVVTTHLKLVCYSSVKINDNVLIGWNCLFTDTDFHKLKYLDGRETKGFGKIIVGDNTWIANGCKFYKNSIIPPNCIVGADTKIFGRVDSDEFSIITNEIKTIVKTKDIFRDKNNDKIIYE